MGSTTGRLLQRRPLNSATLLSSVLARAQRNVGLSTSPNVRPGTTSTMSRMMLSSARSSRRRSVRTSPRVTLLRPSVPSGPSRSVNPRRRTSRSTLPRLSVRRFPKSFAAHPAANWSLVQRSASPRRRPLSPRCQRRPATWSPKRSASTSPSWCPCSSPLRSVLTSPRRSAPGPARTPGRSRSLSSRSGVTSPLPSLVLLKQPDNCHFTETNLITWANEKSTTNYTYIPQTYTLLFQEYGLWLTAIIKSFRVLIETPKKVHTSRPNERNPFMKKAIGVVQYYLLKIISLKSITVMGKMCCYNNVLKYTPCYKCK